MSSFKAPGLKDCKELLAASKKAKQFVIRLKETLYFKELFDEGISDLRSHQFLEQGEWGGGVIYRGCLLTFKNSAKQDDVKYQIQKRLEKCLGIKNGFINIFPQTAIKHVAKKRKKESEEEKPLTSKAKHEGCYACEIEVKEHKSLATTLHSGCTKSAELVKNRYISEN